LGPFFRFNFNRESIDFGLIFFIVRAYVCCICLSSPRLERIRFFVKILVELRGEKREGNRDS